jgi:transcriptional repressor NrdR
LSTPFEAAPLAPMQCPFCHHPETRVVDSRLAQEGEQVRRRRACNQCGERFTTYESAVDLALPRIVKRDASREPFSADKLRGSFMRALEKRPVETASIDEALERIKRRLRASGEREVDARRIGEWAMTELRHLDQVAYIRFASVYREFEDVAAFREEIERLEQEPAAGTEAVQRQLLPLPGVEAGR